MRSLRLQNLFGQVSAPSQRSRKRTKPLWRPQVENMEGRTMLAASITAGTLKVADNSSTNNTITVENGTFGYALTVLENGGGPYNFTAGQVSSITHGIDINESNANNTVDVEYNANKPVTVTDGTGTDVVYISHTTQNLNNIGGSVTVKGSIGNDTLNVYDQADPNSGSIYTMTGSSVSRTGTSAKISYKWMKVVSIYGSSLPAMYNVQGTESGFTTNLIAGGPATVNVGNNGNVSGILGTFKISSSSPNNNTINIDDSLDTSSRTVTLSNETGSPGWGQVQFASLSAPINYAYSDTSGVIVQGDASGNTWNVLATGVGVTTQIVDGGRAASDTVGGFGYVNVGNNVDGVQDIDGLLEIENPTSFNYITVNDSADITPHPAIIISDPTCTVFGPRTDPCGQIAGLAPAQIRYVDDDTNSVTIQGDNAGNTWNVQAIGFNYFGWHPGGPLGTVTTNIVAGGPDTVNVGNNVDGVQSIQSPLYISTSSSLFHNTININDSADTTPNPNLSLNYLASSWGQIAGLAPAAINFENDGTAAVSITSPSQLTWSSIASAELVTNSYYVPDVWNLWPTNDSYLVNKALLSPRWSGYIAATSITNPQSDSVTYVAGTWTVPTVSGPSTTLNYVSGAWVGIDGAFASDPTVEQIGTAQIVVSGVAHYYAWVEMFPAPALTLPMNVFAGDSITASVTYEASGAHAGDFLLSINDTTQGVSASTYAPSSSSDERSSAEWIMEAPTEPLANFGTITFTNCSATINGTTGPINDSSWRQYTYDIEDTNGNLQDETGPLNSTGNGFTVTFSLYFGPATAGANATANAGVGSGLGAGATTTLLSTGKEKRLMVVPQAPVWTAASSRLRFSALMAQPKPPASTLFGIEKDA